MVIHKSAPIPTCKSTQFVLVPSLIIEYYQIYVYLPN